MELLDRYLQSVKWMLPKAQSRDIVAELSEDIRSEIEQEESELGRELNEAELEAILQRWGHPMLVATRYMPQQYLIGPALFPVYLFVLKLVSLVYLMPWLLVWLFYVVFAPSYRAGHPGFELIGTLSSFLLQAVFLFTFITVAFAVAERRQIASGSLERWSPRKLPVERDPNRIPRSESIGNLAGGVLFALWWLDVLRLPSPPELSVGLAPVWRSFYWPILLLALASVAMSAVNTVRPRWTPLRSGIRLTMDIAILVLVGLLLASGPWVEVNVPEIAKWINLATAIALGILGILHAVSIVRGARRLISR